MSENLHGHILDSGTVIFDPQGGVDRVSAGIARMLGLTAAPEAGLRVEGLFPAMEAGAYGPLKTALEQILNGSAEDGSGQFSVTRPVGDQIRVEWTLHGLGAGAGPR